MMGSSGQEFIDDPKESYPIQTIHEINQSRKALDAALEIMERKLAIVLFPNIADKLSDESPDMSIKQAHRSQLMEMLESLAGEQERLISRIANLTEGLDL